MNLIEIGMISSVLYLIAAWFDVKYLKVPDILTAGMWLVWFLYDKSIEAFSLLGIIFAAIYTAITLLNLIKIRIFGWADILAIPTFIIFWGAFFKQNPIMMIFFTIFVSLWQHFILTKALTPELAKNAKHAAFVFFAMTMLSIVISCLLGNTTLNINP